MWTEKLAPHNFMLQDAVGSLFATLAFALVLYAPGYCVGLAADIFAFRSKNFAGRSLCAIAVSFCVSPILAYLVGRAAGLSAVAWMFALCGCAALACMLVKRLRAAWPRRDRTVTLLLAAGWTTAVLLLLVDAQVRHKLYFSVVMADQSYRIAFTDAVVRSGVPPSNPLYFAGAAAPMRYYYFWYVLCAAVVKLAHVSSRQAFVASSVWAGFGLLVAVQMYTRDFFRWSRRQRWLAVGLLVVSGADLLPAVGQAVLQPALNGDTEWWSVDPIDGWPDSLLWVPHHVASVLCCLFAFLLLWRLRESVAGASQRWAVGLAACAFASAVGLSVYVAAGFAMMASGWVIWRWWRSETRRDPMVVQMLVAGVLSGVLAAPFLHELVAGLRTAPATSQSAPGLGTPATPHLFVLSVRRMIDSELLTGLPVLAQWQHVHPVLLDQGIRLFLLLPGLALELGLCGAVLVLLLRARPSVSGGVADEAHKTALFFTCFGLALTMFVSSSVITNNDFGYRAVMLPQFFLLLLTAELLAGWRWGEVGSYVQATPMKRRWLQGLLLLGVAGTAYWAVLLRAWLPLEERVPKNGFASLPADEYQIRQAFDEMRRASAREAVVAFRPIDPVLDRNLEVMAPNEFYQRMLVMDAGRQMLNAEGKCAVHFGGDPEPCRAIQQATAELYAMPTPSAAWARAFCTRFGVNDLTLSPWDPTWNAEEGWPVTLPIVAQQPRFRIVRCR